MSQLTRSIQDRLFIGSLGLLFAPFCGYALFFGYGRPWTEETDWVYRLLALIRVEGLSVVFSGSVLGIIWAIWTPDWIERRFKKTVFRFLLLIFIVGLLCTLMCFYMLFAAKA
jgi:hypothetical protein